MANAGSALTRRRTLRPEAARAIRLSDPQVAAIRATVEMARHPSEVVELNIDEIDESPDALNSRRAYDETSINELAASIKEHGLLQPILVTRVSDRYQVVFGNRRLKATIRAGIKGIKAVVRLNVDEHTRFIYNLVENIQRKDLTPKEKADAIRELAESGYGVRELSRATGLQPSTISRLTRISRKPAVIAALEAGEIDVFKAMQLANLKDDTRLDELISLAPSLGATEFSTLITSIRPGDSYCLDDGRLADVDRKLAKVRVITPVGVAHLRRIVEQAVSLISQYEADQTTLPGTEEPAERGRRLSLSAESVVARQHPREGRPKGVTTSSSEQ